MMAILVSARDWAAVQREHSTARTRAPPRRRAPAHTPGQPGTVAPMLLVHRDRVHGLTLGTASEATHGLPADTSRV